MTYLASAIKKYYRRQKSRIIFTNGQPLQELSISIWEKLGYSQIDTSVISRVINGQRLFTPVQLEAFCQVLNLPSTEQTYLFRCLSQDYMLKGGAKNISLIETTSTVDMLDLLEHLVDEAYKGFHFGYGKRIEKNMALIHTYLEKITLQTFSQTHKNKLYELIATVLYLKGRIFCSYNSASTVIKYTTPLITSLSQLEEISKNPRITTYLHLLWVEMFYIAGGYSSSKKSAVLYKKAIVLGKKTLDTLPVTQFEKITAMRNISAASSYLNDSHTTQAMINQASDVIIKSSLETRIVGLQLCGTLARGAAVSKIPQPETLKATALKHYGNDITGGGVTEVSDLRIQMETLQLLKTTDKSLLKKVVSKGLILAQRENLPRHISVFMQALPKIS
ncbi:MAG: hypothetical protein AAB553_01035 [Patescibacteria group bacterium]